MSEKLLNTQECLEWLRDTHKIGNAPEYRMAILYGNEDAPEKIELYARNHYKCNPRVYEVDTKAETFTLTKTRHGSRPHPKHLWYRPLVDTPFEIVQTTEGLLKLQTEIVTAAEYRFAVVYRDDNGKRLRAVALYARLKQRAAPTTWIFDVGGRSEFDRHRFGQYPDFKFLKDRPVGPDSLLADLITEDDVHD